MNKSLIFVLNDENASRNGLRGGIYTTYYDIIQTYKLLEYLNEGLISII